MIRAALLRVLEDRVRPRVAGLHAHLAREAGHGLQIVREHVGPGGEHGVDRAGVALEVAGQHLEHHLGQARLHRADRRRPVRRAAVAQVVAIDAGDHGVAQAELAQHRRDVLGLVRVGRQRAPGGHVAELARPRADAAQDHDGQRLAVPALADVGAGRALADRVQPQFLNPLLEVEEDLARRQLHADPGRFGRQARGLRRAAAAEDAELRRPTFYDASGRHGLVKYATARLGGMCVRGIPARDGARQQDGPES